MELYKIKNVVTGLFSTGGMYPRFSKVGKIWKRKGDLSSHFSLVERGRYKNCVVVQIEILETVVSEIHVEDYVKAAEDRASARRDETQKLIEKRKALR